MSQPESVIPPPHAGPPGEPAASARAWWESPVLIGLVFSLFLHALLAFVAMLLWFQRPVDGGVRGEATLEIATMREAPLTELAAVSLDAGSTAVRAMTEDHRVWVEELHAPSAALPDIDTAAGQVDGLTNAGFAGSEGFGLTGAGGEARFFGVEARGSRFVFIVDVSGSMLEAGRLEALRAALGEAVNGLLEHTSFCIVEFSTDARPVMGARWHRATEENKRAARSAIGAMQASGGTNPLPAFEIISRLNPPPDAVYFMTDGIFEPRTITALPALVSESIRTLRRRTPIHCITFDDRGSERFMRQLARLTGGTYTHVESQRR